MIALILFFLPILLYVTRERNLIMLHNNASPTWTENATASIANPKAIGLKIITDTNSIITDIIR